MVQTQAKLKIRIWTHAHIFSPQVSCVISMVSVRRTSQIARLMGPTWGPPGSCRPQRGPMLAPSTLLSGKVHFITACYTNLHHVVSALYSNIQTSGLCVDHQFSCHCSPCQQYCYVLVFGNNAAHTTHRMKGRLECQGSNNTGQLNSMTPTQNGLKDCR